MKKLLGILLALCLLGSFALADTVLDPNEARNISINKAGPNPVQDGISPTTGRALSSINIYDGFTGLAVTGRYMPMLVQIDNAGGGVKTDEFGRRQPWGAEFTDVIYEAPLYKAGDTRLTFLFSDLIPDAVGPTRSARVFHAWLREEWDCGFIHYGQQEYVKTSVPEQFKLTGADKKGVLFNGTVGTSKPWKQYFYVRNDVKLQAPHDKGVNAAAVSTLIPDDFTAANHTWLFTDELPTEGDDASLIHVTWGKKEYNSEIEWDEDDECYYRYMLGESKGVAYVDFDSQQEITFNNVIVQFTQCDYPTTDAPLPTVTGTGNADYFMGGKHISGVWQRDSLSDRTVFYGPDGNEIKMQVGRTLIIVMDGNSANRSVSYE